MSMEAILWGAHAARVRAMAARRREFPGERLFRRAAETRTRAACAPQIPR